MTIQAIGNLPDQVRSKEAELARLPLRRSVQALREQFVAFGRQLADEPELFLYGLKLCERIQNSLAQGNALELERTNVVSYEAYLSSELVRICDHYGLSRSDALVRQGERAVKQQLLLLRLRMQECISWGSAPVRWMPMRRDLLQKRIEAELLQSGACSFDEENSGRAFANPSAGCPRVSMDYSLLESEVLDAPERIIEMTSDLCHYLWLAGDPQGHYKLLFRSVPSRLILLLSAETTEAIQSFGRLFHIDHSEAPRPDSPRNHLYRFVLTALSHHGMPELAISDLVGSYLRVELVDVR